MPKPITVPIETASIVDYSEIDYRKYWVGEHMRLFDIQEKSIVASWLQSSPGWFIDLGCGFGRMVPLYKNSGQRIVLLDYAINNLQMIREEYPREPFVYIAADACKLPFQASSFAAGISVRLIQNIFTPHELMQELSRVLCPGASFILSYFNRRNLLRIFKFGIASFKRTHQLEHVASYGQMCGTHPWFFNRLVTSVGLELHKRRGAGLVYQISNHIKLLQRLVARNHLASNLLSSACAAVDFAFGRIDLSLWQFSLLQKKNDYVSESLAHTQSLPDILMCPRCHGTNLLDKVNECLCTSCHSSYPKKDGIYDFRISCGGVAP